MSVSQFLLLYVTLAVASGSARVPEKQTSSVEDPRLLEKVIYQLVTDLPSQQTDQNISKETKSDLAIIPPKREQIKKAIEKSYSIIKTLRQLTPNTPLEKMKSKQSLQPNTCVNTPNGQNDFPIVPDNPQEIHQNPPQNGNHSHDEMSWENIPSTSRYNGPANSTEEELETQLTVLQDYLNEQLACYNNQDSLYGATNCTYNEDKACTLQNKVAENSFCQKPAINNEQNLHSLSTQEVTDTNGMHALANQISEAFNTLNGNSDVNGSSWTVKNQELSTVPQKHLDVPSTPDMRTHNYNVNAENNVDEVENLELILSPIQEEYVDSLLRAPNLFKTALQASQTLMSDELFSDEDVDCSYKMEDDEIPKIYADLVPVEPIVIQADTPRQGLPVAAEESTANTQQNNFHLEQSSPVNPSVSLDPYEFNVDEPTGLTGPPQPLMHVRARNMHKNKNI